MNNTKLQELEAKVARLEEEIRDIRRLIADGSSVPWWKRIAGTFKDDPVFAEIVQLGQKIRREELTMEFKETPKNRRRNRNKSHGPRQIPKGTR
jgi:hypothetical protein